MIESIIAAILAMSGQQIALAGGAASIGLTAFGWLLGLASDTRPYKTARTWFWNLGGSLGAWLSKRATSRFGHTIIDPIENVAYDFGIGFFENFFAKLRADNLKKLDKQLERLQSVGSETRAKAIAAKMLDAVTAKARSAPLSQEDHEIFNRAMSAANALTESRLSQGAAIPLGKEQETTKGGQ